MQPKKIAVYSGTIPSTTFIERMIEGLASTGFKVSLFGLQLKKGSYSKNVKVHSYSNQFDKLYIVLKYTLLLSLFKAEDKKKVDVIIAKKSSYSHNRFALYVSIANATNRRERNIQN